MLSKNAEQMRASLSRLAKASRVASIIFKAALAANILIAALLFGSSIVAALAPEMLPGVVPFGFAVVPLLLDVIIACALLYALASLFGDMAKGASPFSIAQCRRLVVIGCLLAVGVVVGAIAARSPAPAVLMPDVAYVAYTLPPEEEAIYINGGYAFGAIVCFCLAFVFKYGSLLQRLSDDTV